MIQELDNNLIGKFPVASLNTVNLQTSGISTSQAAIDAADTYKIDLFANMLTHEVEKVPLLTILNNLPIYGLNADTFIWNDRYKGTQWYDIALDHFRKMDTQNASDVAYSDDAASYDPNNSVAASGFAYGIDNSAYVGGQLDVYRSVPYASATIKEPTDANFDPDDHIEVMTALKPLVLNQKIASAGYVGVGKAWLCFSSSGIRGSAFAVWNAFRMPALQHRYTEASIATAESNARVLTYNTNGFPLNLAFDSMQVSFSDVTEEKNQILARIEKAVIRTISGVTYICFLVNFSPAGSNLEHSESGWEGTASAIGAGVTVIEPYGYISRMINTGQKTTPAKPIPEFDNFVPGANLGRVGERMENVTQIFQSRSYGLSGTRLKTEYRFENAFIETRKEYFEQYMQQVDATYWRGVKAVTTVASTTSDLANGQPLRAMGGIMDRALFPIRYFNVTVPATAGLGGANLRAFLDRLGGALAGFRVKANPTITLMVPKKFLTRLARLEEQYIGIYSSTNPIGGFARGGMIQKQQPTSVNFNLQFSEYETSDGIKIRFIHAEALDYMTSFSIPYYLNSSGAKSPKDIMLSIDTANIKRCVLRGDMIEGNVQDRGQDGTLEGIRGESSIMLRYPRNHAIILLTYESESSD